MRYWKLSLFLLLFALALLVPGRAWAASYVVQPGDSLFLIGKKFGLTVSELKSANGLRSDLLYPGQLLYLPLPGEAFSYTVRPGDTLYLLGKRFGVSAAELMCFNGLKGETIYPGQVLKVPLSRAALPTSSRGEVSLSRNEISLLAHLVYGEARGEPYLGQVAVAAVVLNRLRHPSFPKTIREIIFEPGAFTAVADGQFFLSPDAQAYRAVLDALSGLDPTGGALYFWNPARSTSAWIWTRKVLTAIGNHLFGI